MAQVIVVTGGTAGVGRAVVRRFARRGDRVAVLARGRDALRATIDEVEAAGSSGLGISVDVADGADLDAAAEKVERELGPIDVWVNNAMASVFAPFWEMSAEEFARVTEVTYLGYVNGTRSALRHMMPRDRGVVVQVGSALAYRGIPLQSAYCGAKHAIEGFTESVRCELYHEHSAVRIGMVHLPALNTPQFGWVLSRLPGRPQPVPPIFQPEVAAEAVVHMAAHPRRQIWVGSPTVLTILANRLVPNLLDLYLGWTGYSSQQTSEPVDPDRRANLWEPVPGDHGAHGTFGDRATTRSWSTWVSLRRPTLTPVRELLARFIPRPEDGDLSTRSSSEHPRAELRSPR